MGWVSWTTWDSKSPNFDPTDVRELNRSYYSASLTEWPRMFGPQKMGQSSMNLVCCSSPQIYVIQHNTRASKMRAFDPMHWVFDWGICWETLSHRATPSHHPFLEGIFPNKNQPFFGVPPWRAGNPHIENRGLTHCRWMTVNSASPKVSPAKRPRPIKKTRPSTRWPWPRPT